MGDPQATPRSGADAPPAPLALPARGWPRLSPRQVLAALVAGVVAAVAVPEYAPGLGVTVAGLAIGAAVLHGRPTPERRDPWKVAFAVLAAVAMLLPALSDAVWVVGIVVMTGVGLAILAVGGGARWAELIRTGLAAVPAGLFAVAGLVRGLRELVPAGKRLRSASRTILLTVLVLGVFGALFASADQVFGSIVGRYLLPDVALDLLTARVVVAGLAAVAVATLLLLPSDRDADPQVTSPPPTSPPLTSPPPASPAPANPPRRYLQGAEWQVPLGGLVLLFAGFVTVQFRVLFGGHQQVLETVGLTYAHYARSGFAQLVVVAILTLAIVVATNRYALPSGTAQRRLRTVLLAALCLLTLIVLVSARHRLTVYEEAFGSTRLRLSAQTIILWLAALFVLVMAAAAARRTTVLPRAVVALTAAAIVAFGFAQPDAIIARANVERFEETRRIDVNYLAGLSADAVPALDRLEPVVRDCALARQRRWLDDPIAQGWGALNRSRARASALLGDEIPTCDWQRLDQLVAPPEPGPRGSY